MLLGIVVAFRRVFGVVLDKLPLKPIAIVKIDALCAADARAEQSPPGSLPSVAGSQGVRIVYNKGQMVNPLKSA